MNQKASLFLIYYFMKHFNLLFCEDRIVVSQVTAKLVLQDMRVPLFGERARSDWEIRVVVWSTMFGWDRSLPRFFALLWSLWFVWFLRFFRWHFAWWFWRIPTFIDFRQNKFLNFFFWLINYWFAISAKCRVAFWTWTAARWLQISIVEVFAVIFLLLQVDGVACWVRIRRTHRTWSVIMGHK